MGQKRNLTLQLDSEILRKARILAVQRSVSLSRLVAEELERLVREDEEYEAARRQALTDLQSGFHLGGGPLPPRDELHDRRS